MCQPVSAVSTDKMTPTEGHQILVNQRKNRPVSPHLTIYKLEQTWFGASAWTRITGITLSGAAYAYFATYLAAPLIGWHVESASLVSAFAAMPFALKGAIKFGLGFPFAFHAINGLRHLSYDLVKGFSKKTINTGEKTIFAASILGGLYLAFGM